MLFKIRASDWINLPVDFSTGKFGALQVIKVTSRQGYLQPRRPRKTLRKSRRTREKFNVNHEPKARDLYNISKTSASLSSGFPNSLGK